MDELLAVDEIKSVAAYAGKSIRVRSFAGVGEIAARL
jgi:hypothetical protein